MLTEEQIAANKDLFLELVNQIQRPNFNKEVFINMLNNSDFFTAPASTKYHNDFAGGLCDHCLKVYDNFNRLVAMKELEVKDPDSLIIMPLFHDLGKINMYTLGTKNVKHYCTEEEYKADPKAYKAFDEIGNYKWQAETYWTTVENDKRFLFGNHEETCEYIASMYIPLRREESIAILHHTGGLNFDSNPEGLYNIYRAYPLAMLLFMADYMASIVDEVVE